MRLSVFFFFNDTATTEIYTLSLHDALPISHGGLSVLSSTGAAPTAMTSWPSGPAMRPLTVCTPLAPAPDGGRAVQRSEEHTSELQSRQYLVCRLLLEKKKYTRIVYSPHCIL